MHTSTPGYAGHELKTSDAIVSFGTVPSGPGYAYTCWFHSYRIEKGERYAGQPSCSQNRLDEDIEKHPPRHLEGLEEIQQ